MSLVARTIFCVSPAVLDGSNKVATPALLLVYFTCRMAFIAQAACGDQGTPGADGVYGTLLELFAQPVDGWKKLCHMFGLCERGLFLSGRLNAASHFVGQPHTVPTSLNKTINPQGKYQWVTRRLSLRPKLDLLSTSGVDDPGSLTVDELRTLRQFFSSVDGITCAVAAGVNILPGRHPVTNAEVPVASIEFDWSHQYSASSQPALLVDALKAKLLRAPTTDLARVRGFPIAKTSKKDVLLTADAPGSAATADLDEGLADVDSMDEDVAPVPRRRKGKRAAAGLTDPRRHRRFGTGRFSGPASEAPETPVMSPLGLLPMAGAVTAGRVHPCTSWPLGAWALQVTLSTDLDVLATGTPKLIVRVVPRSTAANESGNYCYALMVTQQETIESSFTKQMAPHVCVVPRLDQRARSVDFLHGVRRVSQKRSSLLLAKNAGKMATDPTRHDATFEDDDASSQDTGSVNDTVAVTVVEAPSPPAQRWAFEHVFAAPLRLGHNTVTCMRSPGRLWVVVGAVEDDDTAGVEV